MTVKPPGRAPLTFLRRYGWLLYLAAIAPFGVAYLAKVQPLHSGSVFNAIGASSVVAILVGVRVFKPKPKLPWLLFALGLSLFITGDVLSYNYESFFGGVQPFPALSDGPYLAVYPVLIAGLVLLINRRTTARDWSSLIDALVIAVGLGVVSWVLFMAPAAEDTTLSVFGKLVSIAYPLGDVLLLAFVARLVLGGGRRDTAFRLLTLAIAAVLVTDAIYSWLLLHGGYDNGGLLDGGWMFFYVVWGAAALHPSMARVGEATAAPTRLTGRRLALLTAAALAGPVLELVQAARGEPSQVFVVAAASVVLFLLVVARMVGLVRTEQQVTLREQALAEARTALVSATRAEDIHAAALEAARELAGPDCRAALLLAVGPGEVFAAAEGTERLEDGRFADAVFTRLEAGLSVIEDGQLLVPLVLREELSGVLAVTGDVERSVATGLETLAFQVALALESAALTEELVRAEGEARFAALVEHSSDVVVLVDADTTIRYISPSAGRVLGYEAASLGGRRLSELLEESEASRLLRALATVHVGGPPEKLELVHVRPDDEPPVYLETLVGDFTDNPNVGGYILNCRDVSDRRQFEREIAHQAFHDALTGLANRALLRDRIAHALDRRAAGGAAVAVLFLDLDDFKVINDRLGHGAGDELLNAVAARLTTAVRSVDTAARLGGDEFAILVEDAQHVDVAADLAARLLTALEPAFELDGKEVSVSASIGIALGGESTHGEAGADELLRNADVAMYTVKARGGGGWRVFEPSMHESLLTGLELRAELETALDRNAFELHYQPIVRLDTRAVIGFEALIRWVHPHRGLIAPSEFIPLAEETGLIVPIGRWVLETACVAARSLQEQLGAPELTMSVNVSGVQLQRPELVDEVHGALDRSGLAPSTLVLELTETVMAQDTELSIERLGGLKSLGVSLALDDFGTGYSSLNYVRRFPIDILKLDKSFIDEIDDSDAALNLVRTLLDLAQMLDLTPVAEGIEHEAQVGWLRKLDCTHGQGYLFGRPAPLADVLEASTVRSLRGRAA